MTFRFQGKKLHLTYKTHLPHKELLDFIISKVGPLEMFSLVHENGRDPNSDPTTASIAAIPNCSDSSTTSNNMDSHSEPTSNPPIGSQSASDSGTATGAATTNGGTDVPYAHTHVLIQTSLKLSTRDQSFFDYQGIHPNWKPVGSTKHFANTWQYHQKAPVLLSQSKKRPLPSDSAQLQDLITAKSLASAMELAGVTIKTVGDLVHLRNSREALPYLIPEIEDRKRWTLDFIRHPMVLLTGASGTGKTRFALDHFDDPLLVSRMEDLKRLTPKNDGIVFDDFSFMGFTIEDCIHICDIEMPRTINVKHGSVTIPSRLPRIITSNKPFVELFPADTAGALARRVRVVTVSHRLWVDELDEAAAIDAACEEWGGL